MKFPGTFIDARKKDFYDAYLLRQGLFIVSQKEAGRGFEDFYSKCIQSIIKHHQRHDL
jgi:hypothetical protein